MHLSKYRANELPFINQWLEVRKAPLVAEGELPSIGYIAYEGDFPVAVGFLRKCEGNFAILDSFATNPTASGPLRHNAIDSIVTKLISECEALKIKNLFAFTVDDSILTRSTKHGFKKSTHILISREIGVS